MTIKSQNVMLAAIVSMIPATAALAQASGNPGGTGVNGR